MRAPVLPQFSLRLLLAVTTGFAMICSILAFAVRGESWAVAISVALGALAATLLIYAGLFALVWAFAQLGSTGKQDRGRGESPFELDAVRGSQGSPPPGWP